MSPAGTPILVWSPLYPIVDDRVAEAAGLDLVDLARAYVEAGVRMVQLRAKEAAGGGFLARADAVVALARDHGVHVVINDRADIALMAGAAGVHVGAEDLAVPAVRRLLGPQAVIGVSTHTRDQVDRAAELPVSYVAVGPVYATATKATGYAPVGLDLVRYAAGRAPWPVVGIGGITLETAAAVIRAGARSVAVITDLLVDGNPRARARAYLERLGGPTE